VVNWTRFDPAQFDFEFNEEKLAAHEISVEEAAEVVWNDFHPVRHPKYDDRYILLGRTDGGRPLQLIAVVLGKQRLRIITGWPL
jgi:uncharacterized DUF497 family protein